MKKLCKCFFSRKWFVERSSSITTSILWLVSGRWVRKLFEFITVST
jgi:hypothetical protein